MLSRNAFDARMSRIFEATGAKNDTALAHILEIRPASVAGARRRQLVPRQWIEKIALGYKVNADWLLFGASPMRQGEAPLPEAMANVPLTTEEDEASKGTMEVEFRLLKERLQASESENAILREYVQDLRRAHEALASALHVVHKRNQPDMFDKFEIPSVVQTGIGVPDSPPLPIPPPALDPRRAEE